jgi:glycosyltransferase involved in cell wall biosynthesis
MHVALVTKPDRQMTGLRRYTESLVGPLRERGVEATLVYPQVPRALARAGRALRGDAAAFFSSYPLAANVRGYDICHLTSQTLATLLLFQRLPPTVVTVHDVIPHLVRNDPALRTERTLADRIFEGLALRGLKRARALIAISEYTKRCLVEALGYPAERIHVVHRAVDRTAFRAMPVPPGFWQKYGLEPGRPMVLYVGSDDPRKNLPTLVRAFALVHQQSPEAVWVKAGAPHFRSEREKLLQLVAELGLLGNVRFLDDVLDEDLPLLYNAAHVLVLPSLYEGFGLPALEAMSCGTPVVAANRASLPEVVGEGGMLVDPLDERALAEATLLLLADGARRAHASQAALQQAARFSLKRQADATFAVYEGLQQEGISRSGLSDSNL